MSIFSRPSISVLFVCTANICRSPMAEGILREELKLNGLQRKVLVDSAGTHASQVGHHADGRAKQVCAREGIDLRRCRARQVVASDFTKFDYILAMENPNLKWLRKACPRELVDRVSLLGSWASGDSLGDIPDPYYGSQQGFEDVMKLLHHAIDGLMASLSRDIL